MINEELYIITENSKEKLDLPSPSGITLKWVSNLFNNISKLTCSYSYTFKLPMTANNRRVLDMVEDIRKESTFSNKSVDAEFYINGVCLCPKAKLYLSEIGTSYSCVMTWRVLRAFETLKNGQSKLTDLPSLGKIQWGGDEVYGGSSDNTSNLDKVVYPDYDAGVPHEAGTPPKPCVPVYKLIQMINDKFNVKFNIGKEITSGMGKTPKNYLNNFSFYGKRVYDDYISSGVIPLVNTAADSQRFVIKGLYSTGSFFIKEKTLSYTQTWSQVVVGTGSHADPVTRLHYNLTSGTYTGLKQQNSEQMLATYQEPTKVAIGVAKLEEFRGNDYVKPVYGFLHDTGLSLFNYFKGEKEIADRRINNGDYIIWSSDTYVGTEYVTLRVSTDKSSLQAWRGTGTSGNGNGMYISEGVDAGYMVGVVGFHTRNAFTLKGYCNLRISKAAVDEGRVDVSSYMWISLAKRMSDKLDEIELATEKDISKYPGFQSVDIPTYDDSTNTYICHFDFGYTYDARTIEVDSDDSDTLEAYMFVPYYPEDYMKDVTTKTDNDSSTSTTESVLNLEEGDLYFEQLCISELKPTVEVSTLPAKIQVTDSLPDVTCFNFMKSIFYMNGALPRVERDGETISAVYYNALRDNVNDGNALDWSKKLIASEGEMPSSIKFRNSSFAKENYLAMASNYIGSTEEEIAAELDKYSDGYGSLVIDDDTLDATTTLFQSCFYPAYIQNLRYPLIKTGNTCKVWEGDKTLADDAKPIYGIMVYRTLDSQIEDTSASRPSESSANGYQKRMNIFSPFDDDKLMSKLFGYYQSILKGYRLIKEKFRLSEIDLRDFDESKPIYLSKYNTYFAVSTIQRDKSGISTVELVRLPRAVDDSVIYSKDYKVELILSGQITIDVGVQDDSPMYCKKSKSSDWEVFTAGKIELADESTIYAITADNVDSSSPVLRLALSYTAQYNYIYTDSDTGEAKTITRSESTAYYDDNEWSKGLNGNFHAIYEGDEVWHKIEIVFPIKDEFGNNVETRKWTSPIFISSKEVINIDHTTRVNNVVISGDTTIMDMQTHTYTLQYEPVNADIKAASVSVSSNSSSNLTISDVSTSGFTITAKEVPTTQTEVVISVIVTLEDGTILNKDFSVNMRQPILGLSNSGAIEAPDGEGTRNFKVVVRYAYESCDRIVSVTTSSEKVTAAILTESDFSLKATGVTEDMNINVTVNAEWHGVALTEVFAINVTYSDTWSVTKLDLAGLLIIDRNGKLYTSEEWADSGNIKDDADGIAVSDGTHRFVVAKNNFSVKNYKFSSSVDGQNVAADEATALADYAGKKNTDAVIAALTDSFAHEIRKRTDFPSGREEYCAALGEWAIVANLRTKINALMNTIGGDELFYNSNYCDYISSTRTSDNGLWFAHFGAGVTFSFYQATAPYGRGFGEIPDNTTPVANGYLSITGGDSIPTTNGTGSATFGVSYGPDGVSISEVSMESSNSEVKLTQISNEQFSLSVSNITLDQETIVTVKARLNGLVRKTTKTVRAVGNTVVDFDRLDTEHALIIGKDYKLYSADEYVDASTLYKKDMEGIAVSDGTNRFIISLDEVEGRAVKNIAVEKASNFVFPTGTTGSVATKEEWTTIGQYLTAIEELLSTVGGASLLKTSSYTYWALPTTYVVHCYKNGDNEIVFRFSSPLGYDSFAAWVRPIRHFE